MKKNILSKHIVSRAIQQTKKTKHKLRAIFYFRWPWFGSIPTRNLLGAVRDVETVSRVFLCHRVGGHWSERGPGETLAQQPSGITVCCLWGQASWGFYWFFINYIWMDDPLYTSCRNRFPIFHKISAISHMIFTNILPHIKSYKHHEIHLLFGKPPPRFDLTSCFILQVKDGKATATYSCKLACLAILHASTCSCKCKPICFILLWHPHKTELSQVLTTVADVVWLISCSLCSSRAASGVQILMCNRMCRSRTHGWRSWCNVARSSCNHETTSDPYDPHLIAWTCPSRRYTLRLPYRYISNDAVWNHLNY